MKKDWTGNTKSIFSLIGASNHVKEKRSIGDYYATDPKAIEYLLQLENFNKNIWEPACGEGHISKVLIKYGYNVKSTDKYNRGFGEIYDFLHLENFNFNGDIITNPPYKYAQEFVEKSIKSIPMGNKVAMFLKLQFLEGQKRKLMFKKYPPIRIWVSSSRIYCAKNGNFSIKKSSAVAYCWFIWEKGFKGSPIIGWFN